MLNLYEVIRNAIHNPTPETANEVFSDVIIPDYRLESIISGTAKDVYNGVSSDVLAEKTLDSIFNSVEKIVLEDGVDFIILNFGDRITDFVTSNFVSIIEKTIFMITGTG